MALQWFKSYLTNREVVQLNLVNVCRLQLHLPVEFLKGPFFRCICFLWYLFVENMVFLFTVTPMTNIFICHFKNDKNALTPLLNCLRDVKKWMVLSEI